MTPQTAAALRALEQIAMEMRDSGQREAGVDIVVGCVHAWQRRLTAAHAYLAAVLTQEGADKKLSFADGIELAGARGICRSAIIPESAEGAGTWDNILTTRNDYITAAAAVPAGGDADLIDEFDSICDALADVGYIQLVKRLHKLREPIRKLHAPAPRGGVTEGCSAYIVEKELDGEWTPIRMAKISDFPSLDHKHTLSQQERIRKYVRAALSTPPAAQAQDAERSMSHWEYARALAAKEAK